MQRCISVHVLWYLDGTCFAVFHDYEIQEQNTRSKSINIKLPPQKYFAHPLTTYIYIVRQIRNENPLQHTHRKHVSAFRHQSRAPIFRDLQQTTLLCFVTRWVNGLCSLFSIYLYIFLCRISDCHCRRLYAFYGVRVVYRLMKSRIKDTYTHTITHQRTTAYCVYVRSPCNSR